MKDDIGLEKLIAGFTELSRAGKAILIARVSHMETIRAREIHDDFMPHTRDLWAINELIHRLNGYTMQVLLRDTESDQDASVMTMIVEQSGIHSDELAAWIEDERVRGEAAPATR